MSKTEMILVVSENMDNNKNPDRNEHGLVRCSSIVRKTMCFNASTVTVDGGTADSAMHIHQAFSEDIKNLKASGKLTKDELRKVGFVTSDMFRRLTGQSGKAGTVYKNGTWFVPKATELLIGADPEFLLFNDEGNVVRAINVMAKEGPIGSDGAMIEVRPKPSSNPKSVVDNIRDIFSNTSLTRPIRDYKWCAAVYHKDNARDYPVGGHIHLGNPVGITKISKSSRTFLFSVLNKIMDELLAVPLIKLDGTDLGKSRRSECQMAMGNQGYGYYGEWRPCEGRLEHRTLSGLWLMHPRIATCVLGTAKAISEEMYGLVVNDAFSQKIFRHPDIELQNHKYLYGKGFDGWEDIPIAKMMGCTKSSSYMASMLNSSKARSITHAFLNDWYSQMRNLSTYEKHSEHIDGLYEILKLTLSDVKRVGFDIKKNWVEGNAFPV